MHGVADRLKELLAPDRFNMAEVHRILDSEDFDVNAIIDPRHGYTALHCAVRVHFGICSARVSVVEKLLAKRASVEALDLEGNTALHLAAQFYCNVVLIQLLLKAGSKLDVRNAEGERAYDIACSLGIGIVARQYLAEPGDKEDRPLSIAITFGSRGRGESSPLRPLQTPIFTRPPFSPDD